MRTIVFAILAFMAVPSSASVSSFVSAETTQTLFVRIVLKNGQEMSIGQKELVRSYVEACNSQVIASSPEVAQMLAVDSQTARFVISIIGVTCASEAFRNIKQLGDIVPP